MPPSSKSLIHYTKSTSLPLRASNGYRLLSFMPFPRGTFHYQSQGVIRGSQEVLRSSVLHGRTPLETDLIDTGLITLFGFMIFVRS